jgi:hypothetical protein
LLPVIDGPPGRTGQILTERPAYLSKKHFIAFALYTFPDPRDYASIHGPAKNRVPTAHHPNLILAGLIQF